jgi:hypothetical protein
MNTIGGAASSKEENTIEDLSLPGKWFDLM